MKLFSTIAKVITEWTGLDLIIYRWHKFSGKWPTIGFASAGVGSANSGRDEWLAVGSAALKGVSPKKMRRRQATAVRLLFTWRENILAYASSIIIAWRGGDWFIKEESGVGAKERLLLF